MLHTEVDLQHGPKDNTALYKLMDQQFQFLLPVLIEMCCAIQRPPRTARLVHRAWPSVPPIITPITSCTHTDIHAHTDSQIHLAL